MQGKQSLLTFLTVTRWSRSTSNFYVLIGQNLAGEFMRKIFAASGNLLTDSWSLQSFVSSCDVLNCLFLLGVQNEIQLLSRLFCNSWLVCLFRFLLTNAPLVKVIGNPISDGIVFKHETCPCLRRKRVEKSQAILEHLMTFRSSISTGKPEQLLSLTGHEIAPNTVANATKIIVLATKIQKLVAKLATRTLWVLYIFATK